MQNKTKKNSKSIRSVNLFNFFLPQIKLFICRSRESWCFHILQYFVKPFPKPLRSQASYYFLEYGTSGPLCIETHFFKLLCNKYCYNGWNICLQKWHFLRWFFSSYKLNVYVKKMLKKIKQFHRASRCSLSGSRTLLRQTKLKLIILTFTFYTELIFTRRMYIKKKGNL